jgi:hypothetical protein
MLMWQGVYCAWPVGAKLPTSNSSSSSSSTVSGIQILPLNSKVKEALDRRDEAMAYKCTGTSLCNAAQV